MADTSEQFHVEDGILWVGDTVYPTAVVNTAETSKHHGIQLARHEAVVRFENGWSAALSWVDTHFDNDPDYRSGDRAILTLHGIDKAAEDSLVQYDTRLGALLCKTMTTPLPNVGLFTAKPDAANQILTVVARFPTRFDRVPRGLFGQS